MKVEDILNPNILRIPPYIPGDTAESARREGVTEIFKLASNENQLGTSPKAVAAMAEAASSVSVYPDPQLLTLRTKLGKLFGFQEDPEKHIIMAAGSSVSTLLVGEVFINEGDEMVQCDPTFSAMAGAARRRGATVVSLPLTEAQEFDLDAMANAITPKTKIAYVCNPNNPSGTLLETGKLRAFIKALPEHVLCVIDEAYIEFCDDPVRESVVDLIDETRKLIVMRTFSKIYGMAGARVGYTISSIEIASYLQRASTYFALSREAAAGAEAALDDEEFVKLSVETARAGREYFTRELTALGATVYPSQANFIYANTGYNTAQLAAKCKLSGLIIRANFPYSRITVGTEYQNRRAMEIIKEAMESGEVEKVGEAVQAV